MVALTEKLSGPRQTRHEQEASLADRAKAKLAKAALRAINLYGENLGQPSGKHALNNHNYHNSALRHIDQARADKESSEASKAKLQESGRYQGSVSVAELQHAVGHLPEVTSIAQDPRYLYGIPDSQLSNPSSGRHKRSN